MTRTNLYSKSHPNASRVIEVFEWIIAIDSYDFDDMGPMQKLVREGREIPKELKSIIRDIMEGRRLPHKKAAVKQKISASNRLVSAGVTSAFLGLLDDGLSMDDSDAMLDDRIKFIDTLSSEKMCEPIEIVRQFNGYKKKVKLQFASKFGISIRTLEGYLRDLRRIIEKYPDI